MRLSSKLENALHFICRFSQIIPLIKDQLVMNDWDIMDDDFAQGIDISSDKKIGNSK